MHRIAHAFVLLVSLVVAGCVARGDPSQPIPVATVAAKQAATRLVVVLPGRADDLDRLQGSGMADAIHAVWPDADVVFAEVTLDFYKQGDAPKRLRDEVIEPARARGYSSIWLAGASMGGMGTLLYDAQYPGELDGMLLLAPYLGDYDLLEEIDHAGGVLRWDGGPSQGFTVDSWQRDLWRYIKVLANDPRRSERIWLAYGDDDRLRKAMPLLIPALHKQQVFVRDGGHVWRVWAPATREMLQAIQAKQDAQSTQ
jgi:pimeloyl-ACP methyl ester carboxylesterase